MEIFFHWHPDPLKIGDTLPAGKYGKLVEELDKIGNPYKYNQEIYLEQHRKLFFEEKPSRLQSIFLLASIPDALTYKKHVEMNTKAPYNRFLYAVKILEKQRPIHIGSTSLFNQYFLRGLPEKAAACYWKGEKSSLIYSDSSRELFPQEIIVESDIQILDIANNRIQNSNQKATLT